MEVKNLIMEDFFVSSLTECVGMEYAFDITKVFNI